MNSVSEPEFLTSDPAARALAEPNEILRCLVGSSVHGLSVAAQDDRDEMGICVEPFAHFFGLRDRFQQWTARTKLQGERSGPGDVDLVVYSLAKWARLALAGNPTILIPLFAPESAVLRITARGRELRAMAGAFLGDPIFGRYLGYMRRQRDRLTNRVKMPNRPELIERYGFDTKYAGHVLRLGHQGLELVTQGRLTLPMPEPARQRILDVRVGKVSEKDVLEEAASLERALEERMRTHPLGPPDRERVERFVLECYLSRDPTGG